MTEWYNEMRECIERELTALPIPSAPHNLYDPIRYTLQLGGKRIRPVLTLLGCELCGVHYSKAVPQALAIEIFHNFTLVHDDIMDSAAMRRGKSTVHRKWNGNVAILSGDAMMIIACQQLFRAEEEQMAALSSIFMQTAMEVCEGQQLDMDYAAAGGEITLTDYLHMIRLKTAVLLSGAMQIGAVVAGAEQGQLDLMRSFAENLGLAFQVRDDYLDAFGGEDFGKQIAGDIREGKRTWLTVKAMEIADARMKGRISDAYAQPDPETRVGSVMNIYHELDIRTRAEEAVNEYSSKAMHALHNLDGDESTKNRLRQLIGFLMGRTV